ncbi:glycosyltransferase [Baekduia sp. Peel2402]|uniref:glycosyltransferase n=1 Tax=Baekduia sp. Peel2402 TaxID=3458296 RepID=UPI00403EC5EA
MKILLVTQMWPTPAEPDLGSFLLPLRRELIAQGHQVEVAAIGQRGGGKGKYARLAADAVRTARRMRPDVVFAHFLFPAGLAGLAAARAARVPLVVMAHGQDVANLERAPLRLSTRPVVRGAAAVIANSRWLADRLTAHFPGLACDVCDLGVDLAQFDPDGTAPAEWPGGAAAAGGDVTHPRILCVGSLIERKNVLALADAFANLGRGSLTFVGDGPLRGALEGRPGVTVVGRVPHDAVPAWYAACDVLAQPSRIEPFGLATLEAMAMARTVVATTNGGPPEFVTPQAGVLVDPNDPAALAAALAAAAAMPSPNAAARVAAAAHDVARQAAVMAGILARSGTTDVS